ncbi:hypothetical protein I4U23_023086 [Adineta vaga]|nr:hypothetical protein I4U23_023086 [Adineta vaga]
MHRNGVSNISTTASLGNSMTSTASSLFASNFSNNQNSPSWIIDEKFVNNETYSCVICMDTYVKNERVQGMPKCTHYFHPKCIQAWLVGSKNCPVCRSEM